MDSRSKRIIYIAHCFLNTNTIAQDAGAVKRFPSIVIPVIELLLKSNVGIVQLPCPEKEVLGIIREKIPKNEMPVDDMKKSCKKIVDQTCNDIQNYLDKDFEVLGILGQKGSPVCGVTKCTVSQKKLENTSGYLFEEFQKQLKERDLAIPLIDYWRDDEVDCLNEIRNMLNE